MARLLSVGHELNSGTANVEGLQYAGTFSFSTTTVRSGTYSLRTNPTASQGLGRWQYAASNLADGLYFRFYLYIASAPAADTSIVLVRDSTPNTKVSLILKTDRTIKIRNVEDSADIGSPSSALNTSQWYRIDLKVDSTTVASTSVDARIDGASFASGTINLANGMNQIYLGVLDSTTADLFFDDIAINDDSGSFQNSWPGEGEIIHLRPNADGDEQDWDSGTSADAYTLVDEVTPNDATDYINSTTLDQLSSKNLDATPAAMDSSDIINVVQVGVRYRSGFNGVSSPFVLRIMASSGGTEEESATITNTSSTWSTNAQAAPRNYALTLYDLPGASTTAWTKSDLDTTQIGVRVTTGGGPGSYVSTLWLLVDHKPGAGGGEGASITGPFMTVNTSFWGS